MESPNAGDDHGSVIRDQYRIKTLQRQQILDRLDSIRELPQLNELSVHQIEAKLFILERQYDNFQQLQSEIELLNDSELQNPHRDSFDESFCAAKALLIERMNILQPPRAEHVFNSTVMPSLPHRVNLPKLQLTKFNGQHRDWIDFYNMFVALVHQNSDLSNIEKFQYLRSCLTDSAARLLQSLEVTDQNYVTALELLRARYDNKRLIFQAHLQHIFDLQKGSKMNVAGVREFIDAVNTNLRAMQALATDHQIADGILLYLVTSKLDPETRIKWEEEVAALFDRSASLGLLRLPKWSDLSKFLEQRCHIVDLLESSNPRNVKSQNASAPGHQKRDYKSSFIASNKTNCDLCKATPAHSAFKCDTFIALDPLSRFNTVKGLKLCLNCLGAGHISSDCPSANRCQHCQKAHHTLLHRDSEQATAPQPEDSSGRAVLPSSSTALKVSLETSEVLLGTSIINVSNFRGLNIKSRVLLDSASQLHFITEWLANHLRLPRRKANLNVTGIGSTTTCTQFMCSLRIQSLHTEYAVNIEAVVIPSITSLHPSRRINVSSLEIPADITLADVTFANPGRVDMLIGAGIFFDTLGHRQIKLQGPVLQETKFGWIVAGALKMALSSTPDANTAPSYKTFVSISSEPALDKLLERFWTIEEITPDSSSNQSLDELECEDYFTKTVRRCPNTKKFIVRLPFSRDPDTLGSSMGTACRRMHSIEAKLYRNPSFKQQYSEFMEEYINLQHMVLVSPEQVVTSQINYLPHHGVIKSDSSTTRLRVVFDASCRTESGYSLNDILRVGPTLQDNLFTILSRFRKYKYVILGDIAKMYRQIWVDERDAKWQCVLWRSAPNQPLSTYQLQTVTYGTSCAPYLAVKCLQQLAMEEASSFPIGSKTTLRDFYVDNLISGGSTIDEVLKIKQETIRLLDRGGFPLRKFASNDQQIIEDIPSENRESTVQFNDSEYIKTLGLRWSPHEDCFLFDYHPAKGHTSTKRSILSQIACFFDPLGLLSPLIITSKILMQKLWKLNLSWDEEVPLAIRTQWEQFKTQLMQLHEFKIARYVTIDRNTRLHVFADASAKAYGACIYAVNTTSDGAQSALLCSKSRVAPTKEISLPRLELCAALLAAKLASTVSAIFEVSSSNIYCWSDSMITLAWISGSPSRWNVFVANRVSKINQVGTNYTWQYVPTSSNPADLVSRGAKAKELLQNSLWFHGPDFLLQSQAQWPTQTVVDNPPEERQLKVTLTTFQNEDLINGHKYCNSYNKLIRIFAYMNRFMKACRAALPGKHTRHVDASEMAEALTLICTNIQINSFRQEFHQLQTGLPLNRRSKLIQLSPFIDKKIIRVGGRLRNSSRSFEFKHPIILMHKMQLSESFIIALCAFEPVLFLQDR